MKTITEDDILKRLINTDDYVVEGTGAYFWCVDGELIEALSSDEVAIIHNLVTRDVVIMDIKTIEL